MTNDYCFHSGDSVHADNQTTCDDAKLTAVGIRGSQEDPPKTSRYSHVGRAQDDENTLAAPQSADSGGARGVTVAGDHEIDGSVHCERLAGAGSMTPTGPLNVRRNASSNRSSTALSRSGRISYMPSPRCRVTRGRVGSP
ncbi:MAG: hypothetical protein AB7H81_01915 [Vicinamibacterales bacterium]